MRHTLKRPRLEAGGLTPGEPRQFYNAQTKEKPRGRGPTRHSVMASMDCPEDYRAKTVTTACGPLVRIVL
ncbi:protein of unknown function [Candidatus Filomicrobium marinum]|uniref:Uncharacterized protein n=1 Tax=Candidatus Filomicrobium marinum TaxID=1608628 RepID=A0A0D6JKQ2_9HYPH|nr:protein of unknown function [Candidatus Filomicrobium marinum]CPR22277.1 protein of unknown function [Candidatus Filomicrobium marinum]